MTCLLVPKVSKFHYVRSFRTFRTVDYVKADCLPLRQGLESLILDGGIVNKNVSAVLLSNKPESLGSVEPFYGSFCHTEDTPSHKNRKCGTMPKEKPQQRFAYAALQQHVRNFAIMMAQNKRKVKIFLSGRTDFWESRFVVLAGLF
jgi:hypothetical protein